MRGSWRYRPTNAPTYDLLQSQGYDFGYALARVVQLTGLETDQILKPGKQAGNLYARRLLCHWAIHDIRMTAVAVSKLLGISQSAVTRAAYRGEAVAAANSLELVEMMRDIRAESELRLYDNSPAACRKDRKSFLEHGSSLQVPSGCHWTPMT